jgi:hypothetical protein
LVLFGLLSLADLSLPLVTDGEFPPIEIAILVAVVGLVSLVLIMVAWRGKRWALVPLITLRLASAALAVPAFFGSGVPAPMVAIAAVTVAVTVFGAIAVLLPSRTPVSVQ